MVSTLRHPEMHIHTIWNSFLKEYNILEKGQVQGHSDPIMVRDVSSSQDASSHQIWDSYLK